FRASFLSIPASLPTNSSCSRIFKYGNKCDSRNMNPISSKRSAVISLSLYDVQSLSSIIIFPEVGDKSAPIIESSVLLPEPEGPYNTTSSTSSSFKLISFKTSVFVSPLPNAFVTFFISNIYYSPPIALNGSIFTTLIMDNNAPNNETSMNDPNNSITNLLFTKNGIVIGNNSPSRYVNPIAINVLIITIVRTSVIIIEIIRELLVPIAFNIPYSFVF